MVVREDGAVTVLGLGEMPPVLCDPPRTLPADTRVYRLAARDHYGTPVYVADGWALRRYETVTDAMTSGLVIVRLITLAVDDHPGCVVLSRHVGARATSVLVAYSMVEDVRARLLRANGETTACQCGECIIRRRERCR